MKIKARMYFEKEDIENLLMLMEDLSIGDYSAEIQDYIIKFKKDLRFFKGIV